MITQHGPLCDICGNYILLDKSVNPFTCVGIDAELHSHDSCKPKLIAALKAKDWKALPEGPLRQVFEEQGRKEPR